ncbi:unnamed protein product [Bodo saltans]|uniref:Uncharacterized protein n=1 Tax=Bodo saltans TaxID=75058 RepID=A0A0S4JFK7_BODSA|nr:unnamed protein product [Bodo saltans]|eukprot:CUG88215.1 unnamed protein product [Bodo saltans]
MNRAEIQRSAEEELSRRYTNAKYGEGSFARPTSGSSAASSTVPVLTRPGTAPSILSQPLTRPTSRASDSRRHLLSTDIGGSFNSDRVRETLMQLKRNNSASFERPQSGNSNHDRTSSRPSSAALALYELHKGADAMKGSAADKPNNSGTTGTFFDRSKFRNLFQQLNRNHKQPYVSASWDDAALRSMENNLFRRPDVGNSPTSVDDGSRFEADEVQHRSHDLPLANLSLLEQLDNLHAELDARVTREVGGDGLDVATEAESRLIFFRQDLCGTRLQAAPGLRHFVDMILHEHDRYIHHLKRDGGTQEASLLRETLYSTVQELADTKKQFLESERKNLELSSVVEKLTKVNEQSNKNQEDLENYVDELRVTLSTFTNTNLRGAPSMRPDTSTKGVFVEAIRRLAKEVETLREENVRLSDVASSYVEQQDSQNAEMEVLLQKAMNYQNQVGQLKAAVRTMKGYVEQLEQRLRELRNVHEENELLRCTVPMQVAKYEREVIVPMDMCVTLAQHQFLQQKSAGGFVCPAEYADAPNAKLPDEKLVQLVSNRIPQRITVQPHNTEDLYEGEEADDDYVDSGELSGDENSARESQRGGGGAGDGSGTNPSSGRSLIAPSSVAPSEFMVHTVPLPLHLSTRFGNAKLKPMTALDVKNIITELFVEYASSTEKKHAKDPTVLPVAFEQFTKDWAHRRLKGERVSFEQNMSLFYWADVYRYKAPEMVMYFKASVGQVSGFIHDVVQKTLATIKKNLQQIEPANKRQKDRIGRDVFLATVKKELPLLTPLQLEALVASSVHSQEGRYSEDVTYEPFFDRSNVGGAFMYDALARAVIAHAEAICLQVEEAAYSALHERNAELFEKLQKARDENGASGTAAVQQMIVESAYVEKVGKCPLRLLHAAILEVDPHCPRPTLWSTLAIAAGNLVEVNRTAPAYEAEALDQCYDMDAMMRNLRKGVTFVLSPPPAFSAVAAPTPTAADGNQNRSFAEQTMSGSTGNPPTPDLKASTTTDRSTRPPSAKFVSSD